MVRSAGNQRIWIAFSYRFPARLALLRAAFDGLFPADKTLVYDTPLPMAVRARRVIELIRDNVFTDLGTDLVFAPGLLDGTHELVGSMDGSARPFLTAVGTDPPRYGPLRTSAPACWAPICCWPGRLRSRPACARCH